MTEHCIECGRQDSAERMTESCSGFTCERCAKQKADAPTYTPGPWRVEKPFDEPGVYVAAANPRRSNGLICKLYPPDAGMMNGDKPASAYSNAQLIASATDLLEALADLVSMFERGYVRGTTDKTGPAFIDGIDKARAAIAKARGGGV